MIFWKRLRNLLVLLHENEYLFNIIDLPDDSNISIATREFNDLWYNGPGQTLTNLEFYLWRDTFFILHNYSHAEKYITSIPTKEISYALKLQDACYKQSAYLNYLVTYKRARVLIANTAAPEYIMQFDTTVREEYLPVETS